jgi:hypothetical protein
MALCGNSRGVPDSRYTLANVGNILMPVNDLAADSPFRLIDLAKYWPVALLARDPAGLPLYIATRVLRYLKEAVRGVSRGLIMVGHDHSCG